MSQSPAARPVPAGERLDSLDVVRGFALLGILLVNIEYFQRPMTAMLFGLDRSLQGLDQAVALTVHALVTGKFFTMFSLLFGAGFVIFVDRALQRGVAARRLFARRLLVLLGIGALHAFGIWAGDILLIYALLGFALLPFATSSPSRLGSWALAALVFPVLVMWALTLALQAGLASPAGEDIRASLTAAEAELRAAIAHHDAVYRTGSWLEVSATRAQEWAALYLSAGLLIFPPTVLGMFLLGAALARLGLFAQPQAHPGLLRAMLRLGWALGLPAALVGTLWAARVDRMAPDAMTALWFTLDSIGNVALSLAYTGTLLGLLARGHRWLMRLAPAGRMALTHYLSHSLVFTLLFYGYGFGLYGRLGLAAATALALLLYAASLALSPWWLARYRMGPVEWLWRTLTYGRLQPFRI